MVNLKCVLLFTSLLCISAFFTSQERTFLHPGEKSGAVASVASMLRLESKKADHDEKHSHVESVKSLELAMRGFETNRFNRVIRDLVADGYSIKGFYHTSTWQEHWQGIIEEQLEIMDGRRARLSEKVHAPPTMAPRWASLLDVVSSLHVGVSGNQDSFNLIKTAIEKLELRNRAKISMYRYDTIERFSSDKRQSEELAKNPNVTSGEVPTMRALHAYCQAEKQAGRKALVYYLHSKAGCCPKEKNMNAGHWRDMMNAFVIEFPSICLKAMQAGYSTCGPSYQRSHYSGNFWWATCDHVAGLRYLKNPFDAHSAEFFILEPTRNYLLNLQIAENCGYNPFHCGVNHYDFPCPRSRYQGVLLSNIMNQELLPNPTHTLLNKTAVYIKEVCERARSLPMADKRKWLMPLKQ
jgi:hypothetical protein